MPLLSVEPGQFATSVDTRPRNLRRFGVPEGGPLDPELHAACLAAAGRSPTDAALEIFAPTAVTISVPAGESFVWAGYGHDVVQVADQQWQALPKLLGLPLYLCAGAASGPVNAPNRVARVLRFHPFEGNLAPGEWMAMPTRDRRGFRFSGKPIARPAEGTSFPIVRGAIQCPSPTAIVVVGPEGPTLGGYPLLGVLVESDWSLLARVAIGEHVTFEPVSAFTKG